MHDKFPYRFVDDVFQMTLSRLDNLGSFKMIAMSRQLEQVTSKHHVISRLLCWMMRGSLIFGTSLLLTFTFSSASPSSSGRMDRSSWLRVSWPLDMLIQEGKSLVMF